MTAHLTYTQIVYNYVWRTSNLFWDEFLQKTRNATKKEILHEVEACILQYGINTARYKVEQEGLDERFTLADECFKSKFKKVEQG